jgi:hypothetical protein
LKTLFYPAFNWTFFILFALLLRLFYVDLSMSGYVALLLSLYQFMLLFDSIGHFLPVRYLLGSFMCLQFFVGPALAYNGLDQYQYFMYQMKIPEIEYFSYAMPAVLCFIIGLHLFAGNLEGEVIDERRVKLFIENNPKLPYIFILIGFFISLLAPFFTSEIGFVFYLLGSFKFIGLFLLILGTKQLKVVPMILVIGSIVSSSFGSGMFHDLLIWIVFVAAVFGIKYKITMRTRLIGAAAFVFLVFSIQLLKGSYRQLIGGDETKGGLKTFANLYQEEQENKGLFSFERLASSITRFNQGFIITNIMVTVPDKEPYSNGEEMLQILEAAILPRIFAPDKLRAGDRDIFYKYSGIRLTEGTSMGLSSVGDAYLNFGAFGGCIFMLFLGLLYSWILVLFKRNSNDYPILILFTALVFYYPIRPDCELQTILGHVFKSIFLIAGVMLFFKYSFYFPASLKFKKNVIN